MTVAFMCPTNFDNYTIMEEELNKIEHILKLTCATDNTYVLLKKYCDKYDIELFREDRGGKVFNLRKIIQCANKVLIFEKKIVDPKKYSLTQKTIGFAADWKRDTTIINYD